MSMHVFCPRGDEKTVDLSISYKRAPCRNAALGTCSSATGTTRGSGYTLCMECAGAELCEICGEPLEQLSEPRIYTILRVLVFIGFVILTFWLMSGSM